MNGAELIAAERQRQIDVEGWTPEHDDEHVNGELIVAGITYGAVAVLQLNGIGTDRVETPPATWPWDPKWWKPSEDITRNLVKAGALIAAEIDRIQRNS